jgi:hypothetical protein
MAFHMVRPQIITNEAEKVGTVECMCMCTSSTDLAIA